MALMETSLPDVLILPARTADEDAMDLGQKTVATFFSFVGY